MSDHNPYRIEVIPIPHYLAEHSDPSQARYVFAYTITIHNHGERAVQLLSRHWIITDAEQQVQEVRGQGVVGEQPRIEPGQHYQYTSGCSLITPFGTMRGTYLLQTDSGEQLTVDIPEFVLAAPGSLH